MSKTKYILDIAEKNNGLVTSSMVAEAGISLGNLKYLYDSGSLEKVSRGVYSLPDAWNDEFVEVQSRYKRGIFSLGTALFLLDLTDRTPNRFEMTFPATYNLSRPKTEGIKCSGAKEPFYSMGIAELKTPGGHSVKSYNAEKTLCDILRPHNGVAIEIITGAFKNYTLTKRKDLHMLSQYAKELHVEDKVRSYLEVLL